MFCSGNPMETFIIIIIATTKGWHNMRGKQNILSQAEQNISGDDICFTKALIHSGSLRSDLRLCTTLKNQAQQAPIFFQLCVSPVPTALHESWHSWGSRGRPYKQEDSPPNGGVLSNTCSASAQPLWKELVVFLKEILSSLSCPNVGLGAVVTRWKHFLGSLSSGHPDSSFYVSRAGKSGIMQRKFCVGSSRG